MNDLKIEEINQGDFIVIKIDFFFNPKFLLKSLK